MTAEAPPPIRHRTVDVALEARVRRWGLEQRDDRVQLQGGVVVAANEPLVDADEDSRIRVTYGGALRVAVLAGAEPAIEQEIGRASCRERVYSSV